MAATSLPSIRGGVSALKIPMLDRMLLQLIVNAWLAADTKSLSIDELARTLGASGTEVTDALKTLRGHQLVSFPPGTITDKVGHISVMSATFSLGTQSQAQMDGQDELDLNGEDDIPAPSLGGAQRYRRLCEERGWDEIEWEDGRYRVTVDVVTPEGGGFQSYSLSISHYVPSDEGEIEGFPVQDRRFETKSEAWLWAREFLAAACKPDPTDARFAALEIEHTPPDQAAQDSVIDWAVGLGGIAGADGLEEVLLDADAFGKFVASLFAGIDSDDLDVIAAHELGWVLHLGRRYVMHADGLVFGEQLPTTPPVPPEKKKRGRPKKVELGEGDA